MAVDGMKFLVQLRKLGIRSIRTSIRSLRNHPFFVGVLLLVLFLYRSSPFLFSLLVSASPVLVCTAVLLGTLLSFGQPQIPEIDNDDEISCEISSLKTVSGSNLTTVLQKEVLGENDVENSAFVGDVCSVSRFEQALLTPQNSREIVFEQKSVEEAKDEFTSREIEFTKENDEEIVQEGSVDDHLNDHFESENLEETPEFEGTTSACEVQGRAFENEGNGEGSDDGHVDDRIESSSVPWTRVNGDHGDDEDDDEDELSDSGSDGAESSSPDPSMADIIPLLDELHPLIECENLIPTNLPCEDRSHSSHASSISSDEDSDHKEAEEQEEGGDDDEDEEENREDKEDAEKSAISWTENDQKYLMDLGSLELERNQRLESLIARRRARKSMRTLTERNLIDLDDFDLPFPVAPISTTRQNPFDFPNDTYDNMGLPPIPGSAPSTMLRGRNPFDLPYDSGEEKPDLMGDSFQQEFMVQKEPVYRRHESFHAGSSSFFEFPRPDARELNRASRFKPYFIPERLPSGSSYSSFMRQSSELSESSSFQRQTSELSSSLSFHRQTSGISESSSFQRQSSDLSDSKASSATENEPVSVEVDREEVNVRDHEERTPDLEIDHASEHVELGSQSSDNLDDQIEKRDFDLHMPEIRLGETETYVENIEMNLVSSGNDRDVDSWVSEARDFAATAGNIEGDMLLMASPIEDKHYSSSSVSSLSSDEHNDIKEGFHLIERPDAQTENLFEASECGDCHHHDSRHTHSAERSPLETIEEEQIISPSSSSVSEEHNTTENLKLDEALMNMQHISPDLDKSSEFPTEQALDAQNTGFSTDVEENHRKDPVYDLSPQASRINLSISSEELADLENKDLKQERDDLLHENDGDSDNKVPQEDPIMSAIEERRGEATADLFSAANESTEEPVLRDEDALLSDDTSFYPANIVDAPPNLEENQVSVAEEGDFLEDHCLIDPSPSDYVEEPAVIPEKLEEVSSANIQRTEVHPEVIDVLGLPLHTDATSTGVQELAEEPVTDFTDFGESVEGRGEFEFESHIVADKQSPFSDSFVSEKDLSEEMDEALLSELDAVGDFSVTEQRSDVTEDSLEVEETIGTPIPEAVAINENELQAESVEVGTDELPDFHVSENTEKYAPAVFLINKVQADMQNAEASIGEFTDSHVVESETRFDVLQPEPIEDVKQPSDENAENSTADVFWITEGQPEMQHAEASMAEFTDSHVLESETKFNVLQPTDENAEKSDPDVLYMNTFESKVEDAETSMAELSDSHVLETVTMFHVPEPESGHRTENISDENAEVSRTIESCNIQDELLEGTELESTEGFESAIRTEEPISLHDNTSGLKKEPKMEEEIENPVVESVDVSSDPHFSEINDMIEKDEPVTEINDLVPPSMEEQIESSSTAAIDVSSNFPVSECDTLIEKDQPAVEINDIDLAMEEQIESSGFAAIDVSLDSRVLDFNTVIEKDEPTVETNEFVPAMEEEIESSSVPATEVSPDSSVSEINTIIEKAEEKDVFVPDIEDEIEKSAVDESVDSKDDALIEKDERLLAEINESVPAMEEDIDTSAFAVTDASSDSHDSKVEARIEEDEQPEMNESVSCIEEEIESSVMAKINASSVCHASNSDNVIEKDEQPAAEMNETTPVIEEEIEKSTDDASLESKDDALIEKGEQPPLAINESVPAVEEVIERSAFAVTNASSDLNDSKVEARFEQNEQTAPEMNESVPCIEEEIERSVTAEVDVSSVSHASSSDNVVEKYEQPAAEMNETTPVIEEEIEKSTVDASLDSKDDALMEKGEQSPLEINESVPALEEVTKKSAFAVTDASSDSNDSKVEARIEDNEQSAPEMNESVPCIEEEIERSVTTEIDVSSVSHASNSDNVIEKDEQPAAEMNETTLVIEDEIESSVVDGIDALLDSHVSNNETVIEKDVPTTEDETKDVTEMESRQAESLPEEPTPAQVSAESQALKEEDHQMDQTELTVGHLETATESMSVTEESDGQGSTKAAPEMPKREEE